MNGVPEVMHQLRSKQMDRDGERADDRDSGDQEGFGSHGSERIERRLNGR
jgi:hypothetical protein